MDIGIVLGSCRAVSKCENCNDFQMTLEIRERLKLSWFVVFSGKLC